VILPVESFSESYHDAAYPAPVTDPVDALLEAWRGELPDVIGRESELVKRLMLLSVALAESTAAVLPELELTEAEYDVLVALRRAGAPYRGKPAELTRLLSLSSGGTSNVVNHLVSRGLVVRESDPDDGRATWVRLTDKGISLAEQAVRANSAAHSELFADADTDTVNAAADALRALFPTLPRTRRTPPAPRGRRTRPAV
jgi:DNA-binding MarR family transcriptional regulator